MDLEVPHMETESKHLPHRLKKYIIAIPTKYHIAQ